MCPVNERRAVKPDSAAQLAPTRALMALFRSAGLATRARRLLTSRSARRMRRSPRLVLIGNVTGFSGVARLDPFVCITLHLLIGLARLEPFVYITVHLLLGLVTRCGLLLLRRCLEGNRASGNDNHHESCCSHASPPVHCPGLLNARIPQRFLVPIANFKGYVLAIRS